MDVFAYDSTVQNPQPVELGSIADQIWTNGFKFSETRNIEVVLFFGAAAPKIVDNAGSIEDFSFAAGRSFSGADAVGQALVFLGTHPGTVPRLANLQFKQGTQIVWLRNAGIMRIDLAAKSGALVIFTYVIKGGVWSLN